MGEAWSAAPSAEGGKTVDRVAMEERERMRRAWMADSWTVGKSGAKWEGWWRGVWLAVAVAAMGMRKVRMRVKCILDDVCSVSVSDG